MLVVKQSLKTVDYPINVTQSGIPVHERSETFLQNTTDGKSIY
jgi:hypothetical protein